MEGYDPDWIGAIIAGVFIGMSMWVATRVYAQRPRKQRVIIAALIGVALAFIARNVLRYWGV